MINYQFFNTLQKHHGTRQQPQQTQGQPIDTRTYILQQNIQKQMFSPQSLNSEQRQTWATSSKTQRSPRIAITLNNVHRQPTQQRPEAAHLLVGTRKRMLQSIDTGYKNKLEDTKKIQHKYNFVKNRIVQNKKSYNPFSKSKMNTSGFPSKRAKSKIMTLQTETDVLTPKSQSKMQIRRDYHNKKQQPKLPLQILDAQKSMEEDDGFEHNTRMSAEIRIQSAKNPTQVQLMNSSMQSADKENENNKSKENNSYNVEKTFASAQSPPSPHHQLQPMNNTNRSRNDQVEFDGNNNKNLDTMKIDEAKRQSPYMKTQTFQAVGITDTLQKKQEKETEPEFLKIEENAANNQQEGSKRGKSPMIKSKTFNYGKNKTIPAGRNSSNRKKTSPSIQSRNTKQETSNADTHFKNLNPNIKKEGQHGLVLTALEEEFRQQMEEDEQVIIIADQQKDEITDYTTEQDDSLMSLGLGLGIKVPSHLVQNKRIKSAGFRQKYRDQQDKEQRMRLCKQQQKIGSKTRVSHYIPAQVNPTVSMTVPNSKAQQIKFYYAENLKNFNPKGDAEIEQQLVVQTTIRNHKLKNQKTTYTSKAILQQQASMSQTGGFLVSTKDLMQQNLQKQSSDGFTKFHKLAAESPGNVNPVLNNKRIKSAHPAGRAARGGILGSMNGLVNQLQSHRLLKESTSVANPLLMARKSMQKGNLDLKTLQINQNSEKNLFLESVKVLTMNPSLKNSRAILQKSQEKQRSPSIPKIQIPNQQLQGQNTEQDAQGTIGVSSIDMSGKIAQNGKPMSITTEVNQNVNSQIISSPVTSDQPIQISSTGIGQLSNNNQGIEEPIMQIREDNQVHHTQENVADLSAQIYNNDYKPMNSPVGSYGSPPNLIDSNRLIYATNSNLQASLNLSRQASLAIQNLSQKSQFALNQNHSTASRKSVLKKVFRKNRSNESFDKVMVSDDSPDGNVRSGVNHQSSRTRSAKKSTGRQQYSQDGNSAKKGRENKHRRDLQKDVQPFELDNYFAHEIELQDNNQDVKPLSNRNQMELLIQNLEQNKSQKIFQQPTLSSNLPKRMIVADILQPVKIMDRHKMSFQPNDLAMEPEELQQKNMMQRATSGSMGRTTKKNRNENRDSMQNLSRGGHMTNKKIVKNKRKIVVQGDVNEIASGQEFRTLRQSGFPTPNLIMQLGTNTGTMQTQQIQISEEQNQPGREQFHNSIQNLQLNVNSAADSQSNMDNMRSYQYPINPSSRAPSSRQSLAKHLVTRQFRNRPMTSKTRPNMDVAGLPVDLSKGNQQFQSTNFLRNVNQPIEELDEQNIQQKSQDTNKNPLKVVGGQFMEIISNSLTDKSSQPAQQNDVIMEQPSPTSNKGRNHNIFGIQTIQPQMYQYSKHSKNSQQSNNKSSLTNTLGTLNNKYQPREALIKSKQTSLDMINPAPGKRDGATQKYENSRIDTSEAIDAFNFVVLPTQNKSPTQIRGQPNPQFQKKNQMNQYCQLFTKINRGPNDKFGSGVDYNFNFSNPNSRRLSSKKSSTIVQSNIERIRIMSARNHGRKQKQLQQLVHDHYHKARDEHGNPQNNSKNCGKAHYKNTRGSQQINESAQYRLLDQNENNVTQTFHKDNNYGYDENSPESKDHRATKVLYSNTKNKVIQQLQHDQESTSKFEERSSIANGLNQQYDFSIESNSITPERQKLLPISNNKPKEVVKKQSSLQRRTQTKIKGDQQMSTQEGNAATSQHPTEMVQIDSEEQDHVAIGGIDRPSGSIQQQYIENNDAGFPQKPSQVQRDTIIAVGVGKTDKMIHTNAQQASRKSKLPAKKILQVKRTFSEQSDLL